MLQASLSYVTVAKGKAVPIGYIISMGTLRFAHPTMLYMNAKGNYVVNRISLTTRSYYRQGSSTRVHTYRQRIACPVRAIFCRTVKSLFKINI